MNEPATKEMKSEAAEVLEERLLKPMAKRKAKREKEEARRVSDTKLAKTLRNRRRNLRRKLGVSAQRRRAK
jgi:hypothetical protein